ncbi:segregation and condensation protein A [Geopsychrobacter electrodiphilus]|uniref:segregation and condensation protein A n=1 Tax=Geopsychrobacter electrodiphilus TaxID=225196 RepID=UPI000366816C|nr:segregation/condensation protein A [Geopsychrobacter electrodiphilus]
MSIAISLPNFDGPLDLLLHLIKTNEMDIADIQIGEITEQYLAVIDQMQQLNLDVAGEFLVMAATLMHIKSQMLLPVSEDIVGEDEELDPRAELIRRLLEYQRYKDAANNLDLRPCLKRDVFLRQFVEPDTSEASVGDDISLGVYQLAAAFHKLLKHAKIDVVHEVMREQLSVSDYIHKILEQLQSCEQRAFADFFTHRGTRREMVVTFLAMLELVKMRMIKISQSAEFQPIWLSLAVQNSGPDPLALDEEAMGYG